MYPIGHIDCQTHWDQWAKNHPEIVQRHRKVILKQGQSPGDILVFTRAVGDLKDSYPNYEIDIRSPAPEIWNNNPRLTPLDEQDPEVEIFDIRYDEINESGWNGLHFSDAFRHDLEKKLGVPIRKTGIRPELYISEEEKSWFNQVHCEFGWDGPYWILNAGRKQDNELKFYHRWQEVVDLFNEAVKGKVKLVQIGHASHIHPPLRGVLNLVGKTDLRQLIRLGYWAHGSVGAISFQFVMSAAFQQPAVVVAGGKEGVRWQLYPHIQYLYTNGCLPCCEWDGCWLGGVKGKCKFLSKDGVPKCFELITPQRIVDSMLMYYNGHKLRLPSDEEHQRNIEAQKAFETAKIEHGAKRMTD